MLAVMTIVLMTATFVEKTEGTGFVATHIYGSWWFAALWAVLAVASVAVMLKARLFRRPVTFLLHGAFLLILAGALTTHLWGVQGTLHLRVGEQQFQYINSEDNRVMTMPFALRLTSFHVDTYPGTQSAMDYVSAISVTDVGQPGKALSELHISMNNIGSYGGYRFYQSGYDNDAQGTILSVSHDPWGIGITYAGYFLLFLSMLLLRVLPDESFRRLLRSTAMRKTALTVLLLFTACATTVAAPKALPKATADHFGQLYAYYNGRICPLQTVARDFTTKLYGKPTYHGLSAEQVLTGWIFFPTDWIGEPFLKVKGRARDIAGIEGRYASYNDFFGTGGYKLDGPMDAIMRGQKPDGAQAIREADEKMNILRMLFGGQLIRIYPCNTKGTLQWYSQGDNLPTDMPEDKWMFTKKSLDYAGELVWMKRWSDLDSLIMKMKKYQEKEAAGQLPAPTTFKAEQVYNKVANTRPLAMIALTLGIILFFVYLAAWLRRRPVHRALSAGVTILLVAALAYLLAVTTLRGYVSGHLPLSNGFETMQFMAFCTLLLTLILRRRNQLAVPFGILLAGLTLLVSMMGESNPQITPLMPVLSSPLLSLHVCIIMLAYSLLAFTMFNALTALVLLLRRKDYADHIGQLTRFSQLMLYPAVFCLAAGIFIGAIWANQSWGRYWGWDPKETWALITLMVYAVPLHRESLPMFRKPMVYHLYLLLAFLSILMTYFGVNYFLGGMHSYA